MRIFVIYYQFVINKEMTNLNGQFIHTAYVRINTLIMKKSTVITAQVFKLLAT